MSESQLCPGYACGATLQNEYLCRSCQRRAERVLRDLPGLAREAEVTAARLDRIAGSGGHRKKGDDTPMMMKVRRDGKTISDVTDDVLSLLYEWADHVAQWFGEPSLPVVVRDRRAPRHLLVPTAVATLLRHAQWMRSNQEGPNLAHAVWTVRRDLRAIVDRPPERTFAGPCHARVLVAGADDTDDAADGVLRFKAWESRCKMALYRQWGHATIVCDGHGDPDGRRGCGTVHLAAERDAWLVAAVQEELLPLRLLWESLDVLIPGCTVEWETVRRWPRRNNGTPPRLIPHTVTPMGVELFRGGDVLDLARDTLPRRGRRRQVRRAERTAS